MIKKMLKNVICFWFWVDIFDKDVVLLWGLKLEIIGWEWV